MPKEPKLLAEIRAGRERAEKAAKATADVMPQFPRMTATVETLAVPNPLNNYLAQTLEECTSAEHCEELLAHAKQHGYADEGQTVKAIRAKLAELGGGKQTAPKATKPTKRGGR